MKRKKANRKISEKQMERRLIALLGRKVEAGGGQACSFEDAGVLTNDRGLNLHLPNGQMFHITIQEGFSWHSK
jgi:hypothetical protein